MLAIFLADISVLDMYQPRNYSDLGYQLHIADKEVSVHWLFTHFN